MAHLFQRLRFIAVTHGDVSRIRETKRKSGKPTAADGEDQRQPEVFSEIFHGINEGLMVFLGFHDDY
jgi:hypothetical protein